MSFFSWLGKRPRPQPLMSVLPDSGLSRADSTKPFHAAHHNGGAQPANRKHERMLRREQLYGVVRESMVRASVLSSSYKFKVLSLDPHGRQFLVMIDLAQGAASDTTRLAEIEAMIAQTAKGRYDILVTAVYWRANEYVAVGDPQHPSHRMPLISQPAPLQPEPGVHRPTNSRPAPLAAQAAPQPAARPAAQPVPQPAAKPVPRADDATIPIQRRVAGVDPLQADEVLAFKKALDAGLRGEQALAQVNEGKAEQNYTLLTGFEDTEMASDGSSGELSGTQYGALR